MTTRRKFLTTGALGGAAALAALAPGLGAAGPAAAAAAPATGGALTFHIVDGWVLTSEDLKALGLHAR